MENITSSAALKEIIRQKERELAMEGKQLKEDFHAVYESLQPINLIKSTLRKAVESSELQKDLIATGVGLAVNFISKKFHPVNKVRESNGFWGTMKQMVVSGIEKNPDTVKSIGNQIIDALFNRKKAQNESAE